jgi:hypothetical protein
MSSKDKKISIPKKEGVSLEQGATEYMLDTKTMGAMVIDGYSNGVCNQIDMEYARVIIGETTEAIKRGDLSKIEEMYISQAVALEVMFTSLARRAKAQEKLLQYETHMRFALKAQNQCRATLQALVQLKQPSQTTFVKQANISQGHQQVNNLTEKNQISQNKLLEGKAYDLDSRPQAKAKGINSKLEAVGKVHRGKDSRGQGKGV